jgi:hypothetical protein
MTTKLIRQLVSVPGLKVEYPACGDSFPIIRGKLFSMYDSYPTAVQKIIRRRLQLASDLQAEVRDPAVALASNRRRKPRKITVSRMPATSDRLANRSCPQRQAAHVNMTQTGEC